MSPEPGSIRNVSDTALWVATYRADESERRDAHFHDPFARRLAGERGAEIVRTIPNGSTAGWSTVVRTVVIDEMLLQLVHDGGVRVVLNLAAGLDARPWRLALPADLRWFDADLPEILAYKRATIADARPSCRYEARAADLREAGARAALFDEVDALNAPVAILSEGLLVYLESESVAALSRDLAARPRFRSWILDLVSPALLRYISKQWGDPLAKGNAPFRFAPAEGTAFFAAAGWKEVEYRSTWEESFRLNRKMQFAWVWRLLGAFASPARKAEARRFSGIVRLER